METQSLPSRRHYFLTRFNNKCAATGKERCGECTMGFCQTPPEDKEAETLLSCIYDTDNNVYGEIEAFIFL